MSNAQTITVPAGTTVRTKTRAGEQVTIQTTDAVSIPTAKAVIRPSSNGQRLILSFQYKGRSASVKLAKVAQFR